MYLGKSLLLVSEVGQEKGFSILCRFVNPAANGVFTTRSRPQTLVGVGNEASGLGLPLPRLI
jgi:hypothetical protein